MGVDEGWYVECPIHTSVGWVVGTMAYTYILRWGGGWGGWGVTRSGGNTRPGFRSADPSRAGGQLSDGRERKSSLRK